MKSFIHCRKIVFFFLLLSAFCLSSCSIPNLERGQCREARGTVKEFYSMHFGNGMKPSSENLRQRERFLSDPLKQQLSNQTDGAIDYFTQTDDYPKAFRVGGCKVVDSDRTAFDVLLFWKTDDRTEQRTVKVESVKRQAKWLINSVETK